MQRRAFVGSIVSPIALFGLSGCMATTPRSKEDDRSVSQVLVCSLLDPRIEVLTLGITVFGNQLSTLPPNPEVNLAIDNEMRQVLQSNRPNWKAMTSPDRAAIDTKIIGFGKPGQYQFSKAAPLLQETLQKSGADLLFALLPDTGDYVRIPGLSVEYRNGTVSPTISSRVFVIGRDAKVVSQRALFTIGFNDVPRSSIGVATDLHTPGDTDDKRRVVASTIEYGAKSVKSALKVLGYGDA